MGRSGIVVAVLFWMAGCSSAGKKAVDVVAVDSGHSGADVQPVDVPDGSGREARVEPDILGFDDLLPGDDTQNHGACCDSDDDCTAPLFCLGSTGQGMLGTCQRKPNKTRCYSDETCPEFHTCAGAQVCTCDMNCMTEEGNCTPAAVGCCTDDTDCPEGTRCVGAGTEAATCFAVPEKEYQCWDDVDCGEGQVCVDSHWCPCAFFFCDSYMGYCQEDWLAECVAVHSGCECYEGCMDGFSSYIYHPDSAGEFGEEISPPPELLEVAIARYECGVCSCTESWLVPIDGEWVDFEGGPEEFCIYLHEMDEACGGCIVQWVGGWC